LGFLAAAAFKVGLESGSAEESMFLDYYGLYENPFRETPNRRYRYLSQTYGEALTALYYGIESGQRFLLLLADPGTGKTTLLRQLQERLQDSAQTMFHLPIRCDASKFLQSLLAECGIDSAGREPAWLLERMSESLRSRAVAHRRFVLMVDEAQNLDNSALAAMQLLANVEASGGATFLQVVLAGQPEVGEMLAHSELAQLRQYISTTGRLDPLPLKEIECYINHRLRVAGWTDGPIFTPEAYTLIAERSAGIPRNINNVCLNALRLGFECGTRPIGAAVVESAATGLDLGVTLHATEPGPKDVPIARPPHAAFSVLGLFLALSSLAIIAGVGLWYLNGVGTHRAVNSSVRATEISSRLERPAGSQFAPSQPPVTGQKSMTMSAEGVEAGSANPATSSAMASSDGGNLSAEVKLGDRYMQLGEYDKAISCFRSALSLAPGDEEIGQRIEHARRAKAAEETILP
jgi:general secretion pathway protein A